MCQVGVFHEDRSSCIAIGLSNKCKSVLNKAGTVPWCHNVVHFEVKKSRFWAVCHSNRPGGGSTSAKQAVFLARWFTMR